MPLSTTVLSRFKIAVQRAFETLEQRGEELGSAVALYYRGEPILSLASGVRYKNSTLPFTEETLVPVFSATKGGSSACVLLALHDHGLNSESYMREFWPCFPASDARVKEVLSHQWGFPFLDQPQSIDDHESVIAQLEQQKPLWSPPRHGYHPRTFGPIVEECVRRLSGLTLSEFWNVRIRSKLNLEFWIGLKDENKNIANVYPGRWNRELSQNEFYHEWSQPQSWVAQAFHSIEGFSSIQSMNTPALRNGGYPALGGLASAQGLAQFYQACLGYSSLSLFSEIIQQEMKTKVSDGMDIILKEPTAFSSGFMMNSHEKREEDPMFGISSQSFGHFGAGGSFAWADPETGVSFAYVMNQLELGVLGGKKAHFYMNVLKHAYVS